MTTQLIWQSRPCQVGFDDSQSAEYAVNTITENMFAQCDPSGQRHVLMEAILDHIGLTDSVVGYITTTAGQGNDNLPGYDIVPDMPVEERHCEKPE